MTWPMSFSKLGLFKSEVHTNVHEADALASRSCLFEAVVPIVGDCFGVAYFSSAALIQIIDSMTAVCRLLSCVPSHYDSACLFDRQSRW